MSERLASPRAGRSGARSPRSPRSPRNGGGRRTPRSASPQPQRINSAAGGFRFVDTQWDIDLEALEVSLSRMDVESTEFKESAEIFMAARWQDIQRVLDVNGDHHVDLETWLSFWDDELLSTKRIGRPVGTRVWETLIDQRQIGQVGKTEIDTFAKMCQRRWRELAHKGESMLLQYEWFNEQKKSAIRREVEDTIRAEIRGDYEGQLATLRVQLEQEQAQSQERSAKVAELVSELTNMRREYEREIEELRAKLAFYEEKYPEALREIERLKAELARLESEKSAASQQSDANSRRHAEETDRLRQQHAQEMNERERALEMLRRQREEEERLKREAQARADEEAAARRAAEDELAKLRAQLAKARADAEEAERRRLEAERAAEEARAELERLAEEQKQGDENGVSVREGETFRVAKRVSHVQIEAAWNEVSRNMPVDVDVSVSLYTKRKTLVRDVTFDEPNYQDAIILHEDVQQGGGEGEKCDIYLDRIPRDISFIVVSSTIYSGAASFKNVETAIVKVMDCDASADDNPNICYYNLADSGRHDSNAIVMAYFRREKVNDEERWTFTAVGRSAVGNRVAEIHSDIVNVLLAV